MAPTGSSAAPGGDKGAINSEALLPAAGVGAFVWLTGMASLSTLGLVGLGAGIGYGVGSWAVDKLKEKRCQNAMDKLPPALKVALHQWQAFLNARLPGRQPNPAEAEALFAEFAQLQPSNAQQVQNFVHSHGGSTVGGGAGRAAPSYGSSVAPGGPTIVPVVAAEV
mmetsp:Transcript_88922/g.247032  ORF Transcript_88922/g.247032 Transcript_88922/m.247032 type:complete len:166 (+) Transcript_88922:80-577(+)